MFQDVEACVGHKGQPRNPSIGNLLTEYPFQILSIDFVILLLVSARGNTALLLFQDAFSGFVMCKAMSSTTAQEVAEAYEEQVFQRCGANSYIRHGQDPRLMEKVFGEFRDMMGCQQNDTSLSTTSE
uniref:Integrase catalytic domain-containing protein n=1 Tax=Globisporangium ultimum (strain ATCC 200006 / CBS 805.95 / DAOM BR144) TaxID=431595 RepID=K3W8W9_GLOUD